MSKGKKRSTQHYSELLKNQKKLFDMTKQILYSAQILHFYNTNQIEKMKINKGELVVREICTMKPENFIEQVL